ncbi:MAG: DUF4974 domain-containing protein [Prevotella sp.]|nr:DUF4974 domain-containing protein [Prevotella sp.]
MSNYYDILTVRYLLGIITDEERSRLEAWRRQDAANEALFQKMVAQEITQEEYARYASIDAERAWDKFVKQTGIDDTNIKGKHVISFRHLWRYAAAVVLVAVVGAAGWWYTDYKKVTPPVISQEIEQAMRQSEVSGKQVAMIEKIVNTTEATSVQEQIAQIKEELEDYTVSDDVVEELLAATRVTTYHDKEFWLKLDDKTLVHLNYNSKLIHPERFGSDSRDVILDGEAYFMVAKDKSRPFVVHTPNGDVTVYGTEFNVNTRIKNDNVNDNDNNGKGEYRTEVVLVKGSVGVTPEGQAERMIVPGEQATFGENTGINLRNVDVTPYVAWNTGTFVFNDMPLSKLMEVLSKWYNMEVVYEDSTLQGLTFSGEFDRYGGVEPIVKGLNTAMGLDVSVKGNRMIIKR